VLRNMQDAQIESAAVPEIQSRYGSHYTRFVDTIVSHERTAIQDELEAAIHRAEAAETLRSKAQRSYDRERATSDSLRQRLEYAEARRAKEEQEFTRRIAEADERVLAAEENVKEIRRLATDDVLEARARAQAAEDRADGFCKHMEQLMMELKRDCSHKVEVAAARAFNAFLAGRSEAQAEREAANLERRAAAAGIELLKEHVDSIHQGFKEDLVTLTETHLKSMQKVWNTERAVVAEAAMRVGTARSEADAKALHFQSAAETDRQRCGATMSHSRWKNTAPPAAVYHGDAAPPLRGERHEQAEQPLAT